jgi:hypothetical protein
MARDEQQFLFDALRRFQDEIARALTPHFQAVFDGEDPADDLDGAVEYAIDLIYEIEREGEAAAIHDVYRDGAEAALPHVERAIAWATGFNAQRRALLADLM